MLQHLELLFGRALAGKIEITGIRQAPGERASTKAAFFDVDQLESAADWASSLNAQPQWNLYVGAALRKPDVFPGQCADDSDFLKTYAVWADADDGGQLSSAREVYRQLGVSPPFVVVTGRVPSKRAQLWWPLEGPIDNITTLRETLRGIANVLGTDPKVCTGKQLMRLAGTVSWPKKDGRTLERTESVIVDHAAREFSLEQLQRAFPPLSRHEAAGSISDVEVAAGGALGLEERVVDGREAYAFKMIRAHLVEFIGMTGTDPTPDELYRSVAPVYFKKTDQTRPGRGPEFLKQKCAECVRSFHNGQIPFARTLDEAVQTYAAKRPQIAQEAAGIPDATEAAEGSRPAPDGLYEVLSMAQLRALPDASWIVDEAIPECGLGFLYGAPGSFKSFLCYDLALAYAYGRQEWLGRPMKAVGGVLYLSSEGSDGAKNRIHAWRLKHGVSDDSDRFHLIRTSMNFMNAEDVERLERTVEAHVATFGPLRLVFVDTVSRVLPGADENLQKDMTLFVAACDRIRERFGATVVGVHHTNKNGDMRGSTVFLGQGDFIFKVEKDDTGKGGVLTCEKQKEAEDGWQVAFLVDKEAWLPEGRIKEVTSLTVSFTGAPEESAETGEKWPPREVSRDVQRTINEAWMRGRPLSPYPQTKNDGRYAVTNLSSAHGLPASVIKMMLEAWLRTEMIALTECNTHAKTKGLKVMKWLD